MEALHLHDSEDELRDGFERDDCGPNEAVNEIGDEVGGCEGTREEVEVLVPYIGQKLGSEEECYRFYNDYARSVGFSVRRNRTRRDEFQQIMKRNLCCSNEGKKRIDSVNKVYEKCESKTEGKASIDFLRSDDGYWHVVKFQSEHNHELLNPSQSYTLRSHKNVKDHYMMPFIRLAKEVGVRTSKTFEMLLEENGGNENLGFLIGDHYNFLSAERKKKMDKGDALMLLEYLSRKKAGDRGFTYDMQYDEGIQVTNFFWADGRSVSDYQYFGDVVCFDTTYKTNSHGHPIGVFVGLNHHRHTCVFGSTMLYDETKESFLWLFSTFLKAMSGKAPVTILTDQDAAMAFAIKHVFPTSKHRICVWHMCQNAPKNLGATYNMRVNGKIFSEAFKDCIYNEADDEATFENRWKDLLCDYKLENDEWMKKVYDIKEKWALMYGRDAFAGGMSTTQRSESFNGHLKGYLNTTRELHNFFEKYDRLLKLQRMREFEADCHDVSTWYKPVFNASIIGHLNLIYTGEAYKYQENEYKGICDARCVGVLCMAEEKTFHIASVHYNSTRTVVFNEITKEITCSCKTFEFRGIVYRHMFWVLQQERVTQLEDKYVLRRWMKVAKDNIVFDGVRRQEEWMKTH